MKRTIAAILAADVAGYSRLVAADEEGTLHRLARAKAAFRERVDAYGGRVFNTAGDAILAEFPSAVEALRAGLAIQLYLATLDPDEPAASRLRFRMGLTIGDVVEVDGDLLGDGVNIAARLEGISEPGGICLSRTAHEAVSGKIAVRFRDIGAQRLKNIPRPVHALRVVMPEPGGLAASPPAGRRWFAPAAALVAALGLGGGLLALRHAAPGDPEAGSAQAEAREDRISVSVSRPRRACFRDEVRLTGTIVPRRVVEVRPDSAAFEVRRAHASPLDAVAEGQVLADLARPGEPDGRALPLRSPVAGRVLRAGAAPVVFEVAAGDAYDFEAQAALPDLGRLAAGQPVLVTPLGGAERPGRVRALPSGIDPATQLGRLAVALPGEAAGLRPGAFASGVVRVGERCGVAAPHAAVAREAEGTVVYVANTGRAEARPVTTGLSSDLGIEIREGLSEGDTVVARAGPFLREGDAIRPVPEPDAH